jgi:hypothetical protein
MMNQIEIFMIQILKKWGYGCYMVNDGNSFLGNTEKYFGFFNF